MSALQGIVGSVLGGICRVECEGEIHRSLSAVAKAVTGKHWNGYHFFNLNQNGKPT